MPLLFLILLTSVFVFSEEKVQETAKPKPIQDVQEEAEPQDERKSPDGLFSAARKGRRSIHKDSINLVPLIRGSLFERKRATRDLNVYIESKAEAEKKEKQGLSLDAEDEDESPSSHSPSPKKIEMH